MLEVLRFQGSECSLMLCLMRVILRRQQIDGLQDKSMHASKLANLQRQASWQARGSKADCSP